MKKITSFLLCAGLWLGSTQISLAAFPDVPASHPFATAVSYVQLENIVDGYPDGTYKIDNLINRAEFTKIIMNTIFTEEQIEACNTSNFPDVREDHWFLPYVCIAEKNNIVEGYEDGTFRPGNDISFVEAAKIITVAMNYGLKEGDPWYKNYVLALEEAYAIPPTINSFGHKITRGEMAEMIYRLDKNITNKASTYYNYLNVLDQIDKDGINYTDVKAYNDTLVKVHSYGVETYNFYDERSSFMTLNLDELKILEIERQETAAFLGHIRDKLLAIEGYKGDTSLRDAFVAHIDALIMILNTEEKALIDLWKQMANVEGEIPQSYVEQEANLVDTVYEKVKQAYENLKLSQSAFATKHGYEIIEENSVLASQYNDQIVDLQLAALDAQEAYDQLVNNTNLDGDFEAVNAKRIQTLEMINDLKSDLETLGNFQGDESLKLALNNYLDAMVGTLETEEVELITLWKKMGKEEVTQEDLDLESNLIDAIVQKHQQAFDALITSQEAFSEAHDFEISFG